MGRVDGKGVRGSSESEKGWMGRGGGIGRGGWGRGCVDLVRVRRGEWGGVDEEGGAGI